MRLEEALAKHGGRESLDEFERGWLEGVYLYSHMDSGTYYVGTTGRTLGEAVDKFLTERRGNLPTTPEVDQLKSSLSSSLAQGERAMIELAWTMSNVNWRGTLDRLAELAVRP